MSESKSDSDDTLSVTLDLKNADSLVESVASRLETKAASGYELNDAPDDDVVRVPVDWYGELSRAVADAVAERIAMMAEAKTSIENVKPDDYCVKAVHIETERNSYVDIAATPDAHPYAGVALESLAERGCAAETAGETRKAAQED